LIPIKFIGGMFNTMLDIHKVHTDVFDAMLDTCKVCIGGMFNAMLEIPASFVRGGRLKPCLIPAKFVRGGSVMPCLISANFVRRGCLRPCLIPTKFVRGDV